LAEGGDCNHAELLEEIVEESKRMARMVEDLLFLARSDSASLPLALKTVAIEPLLAEIAGRAEILVREHNAELEAKLDGEGFVEIDRQRIEQAVLILVDNAAKYGSPGATVTLVSSVRSGELRISVEDRGPGIPAEKLPRIFERFYRLDKARSRRLGGAGLGLPIAKTIVEAHGGRIEAVSRLGEGTKMTLCLPLLAGPRSVEGTVGQASAPEN
jgi:two-component system sensor histidine kinase VicK